MCCAKVPNAEEKPYYEALPHNLKPHHYEVSISDIDLEQNSFKGRVVIHLKVAEQTDELHLNYRDLSIGKVTIETEDGEQDKITVVEIGHFKEKEFFVAKLSAPVNGPTIKAIVEYEGVIQTNMAGFYKSSYVENGVEKQMVSTQFEATDARRAFPCFDEPSEKATFDVDIQLRNDWTALSNTPVKSSTEEGDLKKVVFETTPVMSTYLLAWACGDFEYIESFTEETKIDDKPIPVRIYTTKGGYLKDAQLASEIAPKILDYFSKVFEVKYPLPKLDLIAVHAFSHNAMENWGLITYRSTALLFSEEDSDPAYKQNVAYVIAHELAHQWFGNLVTMKWWDELWLNEGFATWVGWYAVDYLFPEWDVFSGFVSEAVQQALTLDGLRNSHPIEVPVIDALDIDQLFDAISYFKGASVIHMISNYLGTEIFLKGVAKYLNANKYGNASSGDLWGAISDVSGKPLGQLMDPWIKKVGYPIINVDIDEASNSLVLTQARFLNGGDVKPEENETKWWIPLNISTDSTSLRELSVDSFESETLIVDNFPLSNDFFKFNKNTSGAYRVNYSSKILEKNILPYITKMSSKDRVGLIADVASIAVSGISSSTSLLKLAKIIAQTPELDNDYVTWLELGVRLNQLTKAFSVEGDDELTTELISFKKSIYLKQAIKIIDLLRSGKADKQDFVGVQLRKNILEHVSVLGIKEVQEYAFETFDQWVKEGKVGDASIRSFVFNSVVSSPQFSRTQYEFILKEVTEPSSLDAAEVTLGSLGTVTNPELAKEIISLITNTDVVQSMNTHFLAVPLSVNRTTKNQLWQFVSANYGEIYKNLSSNMVVLDRFIKSTLANYQSTEKLDEITQFFKGKDTHGFERGFNQALDDIKIKISWYERDHQELLKFLQTND